MTDYNPTEKKINLDDVTLLLNKTNITMLPKNEKKWKNDNEIKEYINSSTRSSDWYKQSDKKLYEMADIMQNLCNHSHWTVRSELADISLLLLANCTQ